MKIKDTAIKSVSLGIGLAISIILVAKICFEDVAGEFRAAHHSFAVDFHCGRCHSACDCRNCGGSELLAHITQ